MTTDLDRFTFPVTGQTIRTAELRGEPAVVANDVCAVLQHSNPRQAVAKLPERMKGVTEVDTPGGPQRMTVLTEAGVYRLVMRSNLPAAEAFQDWIAEKVLPAIRRTGSYSVAVPQSLPEALRAYADEVESHQRTRTALNEAAPKADAWDVLASAKGDYSVREAAHILNRDPAIETGQNRLFQKLRDLKLIDRNDIPYATHSRHVVLRTRHWRDPDGVEQTDGQVRITADGLRYLRKRLGASPELPLLNLPELTTTGSEQ